MVKTDAEWKRAFDLMGRFDVDKGVIDIQATIDTLRARPGVSGKVGTVGYCLGGQLAFYLCAVLGVALHDRGPRLLRIPAGFVFLNVMVFAGLWNYLTRDGRSGWK